MSNGYKNRPHGSTPMRAFVWYDMEGGCPRKGGGIRVKLIAELTVQELLLILYLLFSLYRYSRH
jgi:hypothetical protein